MGQILIVEDEKPLVELLAWVLRRDGHNALAATDADAGIELGLANAPQLLVTDWMLKGSLHGGEVSRRIRAAHPSAKTIVITGYPELVSQARAWRDYIDAVIHKPFHVKYLLAAVRRMLAPRSPWPTRAFGPATTQMDQGAAVQLI